MGMFRFQARSLPSQGFAVRTAFAAGGFMFGPGRILSAAAATSPPGSPALAHWMAG